MPLTKTAACSEREKGVRSRRELEREQGREKQKEVSADVVSVMDMVAFRVSYEK